MVLEQLLFHVLIHVLDYIDQGMILLQNQPIEDEHGNLRAFKDIGEAGHKWTSKQCSEGHAMIAD